MFGADPYSNIPFCGSTLTPVYPYTVKDLYRQVLGLNRASPSLVFNAGKNRERTVIVLKVTDINLSLNRK